MSHFNQLSKREWEVVEQLLGGKSNKLIASSLNISVSTVEFHLNNIYGKCNVSSRLELILALWKATGKMDLKELGYSPVDRVEKGFENVEDQTYFPYRRIKRTMRFYKIALVACILAILVPLVFLILHKVSNPESIIIWRGILTWLLPAVAILILLCFLPRISFRQLAILASIFLMGLIGIGSLDRVKTGLAFGFFGTGYWLFPYLIGAGGILIAAWYRGREADSFLPNE